MVRIRDESKLEAIFMATLTLTGSVGIAGLKMSNIARAAGMASGTLYIYFSNKESLLNDLYTQLKMEVAGPLGDSLAHLPVRQQLRTLWERLLRYRLQNHGKMIFMEQFAVSPFIAVGDQRRRQQFATMLTDALDQGRREAIVKGVRNELLLPLLSGFLRDFAASLLADSQELTERLIEESFGLCWDALKA